MSAPVLVTGGSGFVGVHTILALLAAGHSVRTTVRSLSREKDVRDMLLAWSPRSPEEALMATAESLFSLGLLP